MNHSLFHRSARLRCVIFVSLLSLAIAATVRADTFFVTGSGNNTIERFDGSGISLGPFPSTNLAVPTASALDANGVLYVTNDASSSRIEKYAADGTSLGTFASTNLVRTYGLAFDNSGNLYAANFGNNTIRKFSPSGVDLGAFISTGLSGPVGLAFDSVGNLYVANYSNNTVGKFSSTGSNLGTFANTGLSVPYALAFDSAGNLYVSNVGQSANNVEKFLSTGTDLGVFASAGLNGPVGLVFDASGNLYVANEQGHNVTKYSPTGASLGVFATANAQSAPASIVLLASNTAGTLQFSASSYNVSESGGSATITINRVGGSLGAAAVNYTTVDGAAVANLDYSPVSGALTWAAGDTSSKTFQVPILNRHINDGSTLNLSLLLSQVSGATLGTPAQATLTILESDNSPSPTITITSPPANITVDVGSVVPLAASVDDPGGILRQVRFFLNGQLYGQTSAAGPYILNATAPAPGIYQIQAVAIDLQGRQSSSSRTITVAAPTNASPAPVSDIITDADGRVLAAGSTLSLSINAKSATVGEPLGRVDLYANGVVVASFDGAGNPLTSVQSSGGGAVRRDSNDPFANGSIFKASFPLPGTSKLVNIIAVAINQLGRAQISQAITVQAVANVADKPPRVSIAGVKTGQRVRIGKPFTVPASVVDPDATNSAGLTGRMGLVRRAFDTSGVIARVEYYLNELKVKDAAQAPFGFDFTPPSAGTYVLTVIATDGAGLATVSDPVQVQAGDFPTVNLATLGDGVLAEGGKKGKVLFSRTGGDLSSDLTVFYQLKGTATNGKDYRGTDNEALSGSVVIPAGAESFKLKIEAHDDTKIEGTEKINLTLIPSPNDDYDLGDKIKAKLLILDND